MAKKGKVVVGGISPILMAIAASSEGFVYVAQADALPLMNANPPLIEVNTAMVNDGKAAARLTDAGKAAVAAATAQVNKPVVGAAPVTASSFAIITDAVPPESKRGFGRGNGAPAKYPFEQLAVNASFFVAKSAEMDNPLKTMGSTVSNANNKYRTETGATETKERTKRGSDHKAVTDATGNKVKETVTVPVYKQDRKFIIRSVTSGTKYGNWTAPADGALITRTL